MNRKSRFAPISDENRRLADRWHSAAIHLLRCLRRTDETSGLSRPKLSALSVVVHAGPITLGALAEAEQVRPPTMTRLIRELEHAGLVRRQGDQNDARVTRVAATPAGKRLLKQGRSRRADVLAEWIGGLSQAEILALEKAVPILETFRNAH
jgi:DNA-binding MarR family transcriptional regulator